MPAVRRRRAVQGRHQEPTDEQRARMQLYHEVSAARMYRMFPETSPPSTYRDERWWAEVGEPAMKRRSEERWVAGSGWVHFPGVNDDRKPGARP